MSKKHRYRASQPAQQKADPNVAVVVSQQSPATPAMMPRNMRAYIQEGYRGSKTVFRVVGHIARAASGIKWKHYTDETKQREIEPAQSKLLQIWKNPSPGVSGTAFREAMTAYYCLTGNNYLLGINAANNPALPFDELYNLRPDLTKIKVDDDGPVYYEFGTFTPPKRYQPQQVMHNKLFAGNDDVYGLSPVEVAALLVDMQKAGQKWNLSLLSNMARPGGAWVTDALLGDTEYKGLKEEIRKKFGGPRNAGETAILHGGVKWQSMSMSPMELDWLESDTKTDRDIAGIFFNFPLFLLGLADTTFNNQSEAKHALYTEIVFPILDMFEDSLNMWLTPRYGGYLGYDREDVETIQERLQAAKAAASETASAQWQAGLTTFHEARTIQGKEELKGVKDFIMLNEVPVFVDQLNEYIQAAMDKITSPPPPPPVMLPPGKTTVTEDDTEQDEDSADDPPQKALSAPHYHVKALDLATAEQKAAYFKSVEAQRKKWEADAQDRIQEYFKTEQKTVMAAVNSATEDTASARVNHAVQTMGEQGTLKHAIVSLYQDVGTDAGQEVQKDLKHDVHGLETKAGRDFSLYAPDVLIYLLQMAAQKVVQINETTRAQLQSTLEDGVKEGESIIQLAKRVDQLYLQEIIPNRSRVIAHTETIAASNYGSQEAAKASGLTLKKVWLATDDNHTRPDHVDANGQKVDLDQPFTVGGSKMMFPGDNSLGAVANEIIQCRCTQYYERVKEAEPIEDETEVGKSLMAYIQSLPSVNISREQYRNLLRMKS